MTQELTPEQRLTQIEKILQSAIKLSHSNTAKIEANTEAIKANSGAIALLTNRVDRLTEQIATATDIFVDSIGVMREMQNEIKGLQVENRRIMDHLFGEES